MKLKVYAIYNIISIIIIMLSAHINEINDSYLNFYNIKNIILCGDELLLYSYIIKCNVFKIDSNNINIITKILIGVEYLKQIKCKNVIIIYNDLNIKIAENIINAYKYLYDKMNNEEKHVSLIKLINTTLINLGFTKDTWTKTQILTNEELNKILLIDIGHFHETNINYPKKYPNIEPLTKEVINDFKNNVIPDKSKSRINRMRKEHTPELIDLNEKETFLLINGFYKINYEKCGFKVELTDAFFPSINADAYVNTANEALQGGGGMDELIHKYAGESLKRETAALPNVTNDNYYFDIKCLTGDSKISSGHNLKAKYVIHTVTPYLDEKGNTNKDMHISCYKSSLKYVDGNNIKSIVFGPLSTGYYGYPMLEATILGLKVISEFLKQKNNDNIKIILCVYNDTQYKIYKYLIPYFF